MTLDIIKSLAMNNRVYKLTGVVNFAWFDGGGEYDYYLAEGNFWD